MPLPIRSRPNKNTDGALTTASTTSPTGLVIHPCATAVMPLFSEATASTNTESSPPNNSPAPASPADPAAAPTTPATAVPPSIALVNGSRIKSSTSACARGTPTPEDTAATVAAPTPNPRTAPRRLLRLLPTLRCFPPDRPTITEALSSQSQPMCQ